EESGAGAGQTIDPGEQELSEVAGSREIRPGLCPHVRCLYRRAGTCSQNTELDMAQQASRLQFHTEFRLPMIYVVSSGSIMDWVAYTVGVPIIPSYVPREFFS
ncbi:hypothetical protein ANCDUO_15439, partial [Ancylostoma duodenale]